MNILPHTYTRLANEAIRAAQAAGDLPDFTPPELEIKPSKRAEQGDYNVAVMPLAKLAKRKPLEIAEAVAKHIMAVDSVGKVEVAPPGYINFFINEDWLRAQTEQIIAEGDDLFALALGDGQRAQVEFVSANPTGPLTVGRSRGAVVGDTMARLLEAAGYSVQREYYFNNAGAQMRVLGNSLRTRYLEALGQSVEIPDKADKSKPFYHGDYLKDLGQQLAAERGDALTGEDWQPFKAYGEQYIFEMIRSSLQRIDITHDNFFNENSLYESETVWKVLADLEARGYVYRAVAAEGDEQADAPDELPADQAVATAETNGKGEAVWFRSTQFGDDKDRVMVKSSGEPTYTLPDIAYHVDKLERGFDVLINVLGADHAAQWKVVQYGLRALDQDGDKLNVILMQLVKLLRDGKEVRMSTRMGEFETLDDLVEQTSADAVRYFLLARDHNSHLNFDLDLAVKQSNENPVYYIQYAHVRCAGIFREAALRGVTDEDADLSLLGEAELRFLRKAFELGEVIELSVRNFEPHRIAFYALELANVFHPIFDGVRVLHSEVPPEVARARLRFYRAAQIVFRRTLRLMGMSSPDHM
ncbi:MAG: arginine--tRNA ligase [Chloroflexi bacterium]|nr:arginine--tRNA ligase [Chloroflexota bacterium]